MALSPDQRRRLLRMNMLMAYASFASSKAVAWTPATLFANAEVGGWYDPSDLTTLFQDAAGTTPVTAVEQPVGRVLDKSGRGNHLSQSTSTARPVLSARVNLLTRTEEFDNAAWTKTSILAFGSGSTANATTDPLGGSTADLITSAAATAATHVSQGIAVSATTYTFAVYAKDNGARYIQLSGSGGASNGHVNFDLQNGSVGSANLWTGTISSAGNGWYRLVASTDTLTAATLSFRICFVDSSTAGRASAFTGDGVKGAYLWGADLRPANAGAGLPAYQRVGAATSGTSSAAGNADYDTTGFPLYLKFDGTDDFLVSGTINPGSVDKAQVFAGVRKLSDAATGLVMEYSANSNTNNGAIFMCAPASAATASYNALSKGTVAAVPSYTNSLVAAPVTNTVSLLADIAGDSAALRVNGAQVDQVTTDQGTGNFGSHALYVGARAGTSLRLNASIYSLILRFSATNLDAATIASTETWVNNRTKAY